MGINICHQSLIRQRNKLNRNSTSSVPVSAAVPLSERSAARRSHNKSRPSSKTPVTNHQFDLKVIMLPGSGKSIPMTQTNAKSPQESIHQMATARVSSVTNFFMCFFLSASLCRTTNEKLNDCCGFLQEIVAVLSTADRSLQTTDTRKKKNRQLPRREPCA